MRGALFGLALGACASEAPPMPSAGPPDVGAATLDVAVESELVEAPRQLEPVEARFAERQPDLALILIDTLRVSRLGLGGAKGPDLMPWLTAFTEQSVHFPRALSTSTFTPPSTASVLTGRYPVDHGVIIGLRTRVPGLSEEVEVVPLQVPSVAETLQAAGWSTVALAANFNVGPELGLSRGFDYFRRVGPTSDAEHVPRGLDSAPDPGEAPRFTYLHYNDPHEPLQCRPPVCEGSEDFGDRYDSELRYLDGHLEEHVNRLREESAARQRDLVVLVTSDHGELFGEYGLQGHPAVMWHPLQEVLMVVQIPGVDARRAPDRVSLVDVAPTLLALAGLPGEDLDGSSLLASARGEAEIGDGRPLYAHRANVDAGELRQAWAVVQGAHKLVLDGGRSRLFDADSPEVLHEARAQGAELDELQALLDAHRADFTPGVRITVGLSPEQTEQLGAMGYVEGWDADQPKPRKRPKNRPPRR